MAVTKPINARKTANMRLPAARTTVMGGTWLNVNADHTGNPNVYFMLINAPGRIGNDLCLDDITFRPPWKIAILHLLINGRKVQIMGWIGLTFQVLSTLPTQ